MASLLIVEDSPTQVAGLALAVDQAGLGWRVLAASSFDEAWTQAQAQPPEAAIVDVGLPDGDGIALATRLRALNPSLHTVLVTGWDSPQLRARARGAGAAALLVKPVSSAELLRAVAPALGADGALGDGGASIDPLGATAGQRNRAPVEMEGTGPMSERERAHHRVNNLLSELLTGLRLLEIELTAPAAELEEIQRRSQAQLDLLSGQVRALAHVVGEALGRGRP